MVTVDYEPGVEASGLVIRWRDANPQTRGQNPSWPEDPMDAKTGQSAHVLDRDAHGKQQATKTLWCRLGAGRIAASDNTLVIGRCYQSVGKCVPDTSAKINRFS